MSELKFVRGIVILFGLLVLGLLFSLIVKRPISTTAAAITPPPRTPAVTKMPPEEPPTTSSTDSEREKSKDGGPKGAVLGQVIDLSTGEPGRGLDINISGRIVRTDSDGRYSLTGLTAGTYEVSLMLPGGVTSSQNTWVVIVGDREALRLDLSYYSGPAPTPTPPNTPTSTPVATEVATPLPAPAPVLISPSNRSVVEIRPVGDEPIVWISPGHINNEQGAIGFINIDVSNVVDFGAFQATLNFDPAIIEVETVTLGDFLDSTGRDTTPLATEIDNRRGEISLVAFTSGDNVGPQGGGTLAVVNFVSKRAGFSALELRRVRLFSSLGNHIEVDVSGGLVQVMACFGDLNGDKVIDVGDVQLVAGRTNQFLDDPNYVMEYDVNSDGVINNVDVALISERLNNICP